MDEPLVYQATDWGTSDSFVGGGPFLGGGLTVLDSSYRAAFQEIDP